MIVNCAVYADGRRVADIRPRGDQRLRRRARALRVDRALRAQRGRAAAGAGGARSPRPRHRGRAPRASAPEARGVRAMASSSSCGRRTWNEASARSTAARRTCSSAPRYVVSVRHGEHRLVRRRARALRDPRREHPAPGPGFVLYAIMDFVVDRYFPIIDAFRGGDREARGRDLRGPLDSATSPERIYDLKREHDRGEARRLSAGRRVQPARALRQPRAHPRGGTAVLSRRLRSRRPHQRERRVRCASSCASALEANLALTSIRQNEVMKQLASWAGDHRGADR